jgi:hypothetical protein
VQALSPTTDLTAIIIGVIGNFIYGLILVALRRLRQVSVARNPRHHWIVPALAFALWLVFNFGYAYFIYRYKYVVLLTSTILSAWILFQEINQFWRIGLVGADFEIRLGIDYTKALGLCSNSLDFLGIGASKLTDKNESFKAAISRCDRPGRPIRFLLSSPESVDLKRIAHKAGVDEGSYQKKVRESLRVIADLRNNRAKNIEVRFYKQFPAFRLMFIDDDICLMSHYVLGSATATAPHR